MYELQKALLFCNTGPCIFVDTVFKPFAVDSRAENCDRAPFLLKSGRHRVARFCLVQLTKIYQMTPKDPKWLQNVLNELKIFQMATKYTDIFSYICLPNLTKLVFLV
jgi:hypothetical protein